MFTSTGKGGEEFIALILHVRWMSLGQWEKGGEGERPKFSLGARQREGVKEKGGGRGEWK